MYIHYSYEDDLLLKVLVQNLTLSLPGLIDNCATDDAALHLVDSTFSTIRILAKVSHILHDTATCYVFTPQRCSRQKHDDGARLFFSMPGHAHARPRTPTHARAHA